MFDFAWSEIVLIGAVALIAIGPKDMPAAIRTVSSMVKKARRMAAEFQTHVDEMVREADLGDVKKAFNDIRNLDLSSAIEKHVDPDRTIRDTFSDNPLESTYATPRPVEEVTVAEPAVPPVILSPPEPEKPLSPAFIPPGMVPPAPPVAVEPPEPPAFIPPEAVRLRQSRA
ncbi:MAG TPA: twin-arginine translocase subunit TatB [Acetobacteraceae bacterium]|jgi:sec-independent protein translocase protein TatB|nr:twin-arginine translocase subunit TatB [Acetobacteraceae bacterium]